MSFYFVLSGTLAILTAFGVFESFIKKSGVNRFFVALFLLVTAVLSLFGNIEIGGYGISLNLFVYAIAFIVLLTKLKSVKGILAAFISCLIILAFLVCYNAFDLSNFEYNFVQPYIYLALLCGCILAFICPNVSSVFCGTLLGGLIFEVAIYNINLDLGMANLQIGGELALTCTLLCCVSYALFFGLKQLFVNFRLKKQSKTNN